MSSFYSSYGDYNDTYIEHYTTLNNWKKINNVNYPNNDIDQINAVSATNLSKCTEQCDKNLKCIGFSINNNDPKHKCWLKSALGNVQTENNTTMHYLDIAKTKYNYEPQNNINYPGNDITQTFAASATDLSNCSNLCDNTKDCMGFIINKNDAKNKCWLKKSFNNGYNENGTNSFKRSSLPLKTAVESIILPLPTFINEDNKIMFALILNIENNDLYTKCKEVFSLFPYLFKDNSFSIYEKLYGLWSSSIKNDLSKDINTTINNFSSEYKNNRNYFILKALLNIAFLNFFGNSRIDTTPMLSNYSSKQQEYTSTIILAFLKPILKKYNVLANISIDQIEKIKSTF